jgi:spore germination protein KB
VGKKISPYQLMASMFVLPYGSAILFFLGGDAKQDAWLAILFYILPALLLQLIYIKLFKYYPNDNLVTYLPKIFGKHLGSLISLIYITYFSYLATRILRDFSSLIVFSSMPQTPHLYIAALLILTVLYGVTVGIEPICRAAEILFPLMILGLFAAILLLVATKNVLAFNRLMPVLENGPLFPIIKGWKLITFPYGELVTFTMLFNDLNEPKKIKIFSFAAIIVEGIVLSTLTVLYLASLGEQYASITNFPLLETLRLIRVGGFLDRLDILIIVTMVVAGFMKMSFFMYFSSLGITELFKLKNRNMVDIFLSIVIFISAELIARTYPEHLKIGFDFTVKYIHLPLQIGIPVIALIIAYFKNKKCPDCNK